MHQPPGLSISALGDWRAGGHEWFTLWLPRVADQHARAMQVGKAMYKTSDPRTRNSAHAHLL
jgi:hypothetical protein